MEDIEMLERGTDESDSPIQTDEEQQLAQRVQQMFRFSWDTKNQLLLNDLWRKCDDYKHNRQNPQQSPEHPGSVTNVLHRVIENQISDLLDKPYSSTVKGREPGDDMFAEQAQHVLDYILDMNRVVEKMNTAEHDRLELGSSIIKVWFDDDELDGRGLPVCEVVSPANFFPDAKIHTTQNLQKSEYIIHAIPKPLSWFRDHFKLGKYVRREVAIPYNPQQVFSDDRADEAHVPTSQKALLLECYMRDENGEVYCLHVANDILLEDSRKTMKGKKLQRRNMYPFVMINCYPRRGTLWGMGDIEVLMPQVDLINELDDQIRMNARLMGNPQVVIGFSQAGRGFDPRKWTAAPGLRIPMRDINGFRMVEAQRVSPDVIQRREKAFQEVDLISGVQDVNRGQPAGGVTAASAIQALQQSGQKMVVHKNKMFTAGWSQVLELLFDEAVNNWDEEMWVRINGEQPDWKFINMSDFNNVPSMIPNALHGVIPGEESIKQLTDEKGNPQTREAQFDFTINMGNGLPNDKMAMLQIMTDFAKLMFPDGPGITRTEFRNFARDNLGLDLEEDQPPNPMGSPPGQMPGQPPQMPGGMTQGMPPEQQMPPPMMQQTTPQMGGVM